MANFVLPVNAGRFNELVMYCGVYAPWDHYPKFLRQSEVRNPMIPLKGFFDANDVEGHFEKLKRWRHYVVNDEHYDDECFGPGNLLYDYELNLRLLESLYLLLLEDEEPSYSDDKITEEQLASEKAEWAWYPNDLTKKELLNPYLVIKAAFNEIQPEAFRDHLWEWINAALSSNAIDESITPSEIITVYEHIKKMYSAAWLIFQRETGEPFLKEKPVEDNKILRESEDKKALAVMADPIRKNVSIKATPAQKLGLKEVTKLILKIEPTVQMVCHFHTSEEPFIFFLLIIVANDQAFTNDEIAAKIEQGCAHLVTIAAFVKKQKWFEKPERRSSSFYYYAFRLKDVTYQSTSVTIPEYPKYGPYMTQQEIDEIWDRTGHHGHELYFKAQQLQLDKNYTECLSTVKEAINYTLKSMIAMMTGFMPATNDHNRLLKMSLLCSVKIWGIFHKDTESSISAMDLLNLNEPLLNGPIAQTEDEAGMNVLMLNAYLLNMIARDEYQERMADVNHHST
ncbi:hypothetical protein [Mucilaginibacter ginsenosidivorax]|uniref:Uncharacterized protein n=1 Tax=Mucilaginibacter ginsenosidivorax TaxID=862126 RepID=A0A5B8W4L3_9SPHI|nr:hypothetical protein [Mucilaginibacter ginsenosidivorax]QEC77278.1 hypothetical protein FSB76_15495 [Mucilaginibacter ginsenosidivorax]